MKFVHLHEFPYEVKGRGLFKHHFAPEDGAGRAETLIAARAWCEDQFGPASYYQEPTTWCQIGWSIIFGSEDDAMQFKMRWC